MHDDWVGECAGVHTTLTLLTLSHPNIHTDIHTDTHTHFADSKHFGSAQLVRALGQGVGGELLFEEISDGDDTDEME